MAVPIATLENQVVASTGSTQDSLVPGLRVLLLDAGSDYFKYTLLQNIDKARVNGGSRYLTGGSGTDAELQTEARDLILGTMVAPASYDGDALSVALNRAREVADDTGIDLTTGADVAFKFPNSEYLAVLKNDSPELVGAYMRLSQGGQTTLTVAQYDASLVGSSSYMIRKFIDDLSDTQKVSEKDIAFYLFKSYDIYSAAIELLEEQIRFLSSDETTSGTASKIKIGEIEIDRTGTIESRSTKIARFQNMQNSIRELRNTNLPYDAIVVTYPEETRDVITKVYNGPNQDAQLTGNLNIIIGGT